MKKIASVMIMFALSASAMASVVTESGESVKNSYGETWQTPDSK